MYDFDLVDTPPIWAVLADVEKEVASSTAKHGDQSHLPDGTSDTYRFQADAFRRATDRAFAAGRGTWRHILAEEFFEALAETDPAKLRAELVQVGAVAAKWAEAIDRRTAPASCGCEGAPPNGGRLCAFCAAEEMRATAVPHD